MKILYLAHANSPHNQNWARHFVQRGYEVRMASLQDAKIDGVFFHPLKRISKTKFDYLWNIPTVRRLVHELRPDLLHAHYSTSYGLLGAACGFHPLVITTWGQDVFDFPNMSLLHRGLLRWNLAKADIVCALSRQLATATNALLPEGKTSRLTFFGIDLNRFHPVDRSGRTSLTVGIIKTLEPKYGIEFLIRAFARVKEKIDGLNLLIAGDGGLRKSLENLAFQLGVAGQTRFIGRISHAAVPEWLGKIDIFVNPSIHESETFGVVVAEASATELPVIASHIGGLPEVVRDGETGFLVPPRDVEALSQKIERLATDALLRHRMGKNGRKFIQENYEWGKNAKVMEEIYLSLLRK